MNIFGIDKNPKKIPPLMIDNYVNRLLSEGTICFCNALHFNKESYFQHAMIDFTEIKTPDYGIYPAAQNTWFVEQLRSVDKLFWLYNYLKEFHKEFQFRCGKLHKCGVIVESEIVVDYLALVERNNYIFEINDVPINDKHPLEFKHETNVKSYQEYYKYKLKYLLEKSYDNSNIHGICYTKRPVPEQYWDIFKEHYRKHYNFIEREGHEK